MGISVYRDCVGGRELVARIEFSRGEFSRLQYDEIYLAGALRNGELGISERLPLSDAPYDDQDIAPFFKGILPEGEVFDNLVHLYQVPRNDYLGLISRLGCESIGALTFLADGASADEFVAKYEPLSPEAVEQMAKNPVRVATQTASATRLSLSGAQSKVAWFLPEGLSPREASIGDWLVPRGTAPSTHIIKVSRKGEEDLAVNELACSFLSRSCGIETAEVFPLQDIPGALAIRRYDRVWLPSEGSSADERMPLRIHQEDFCQALGFSPYLKYQPEDIEADYIAYAADLIGSTVANPISDQAEFAKRLVFNYAVGNSDAHLKNYSLLYDESWKKRRLAPAYDVTCIPLSGYSTKMSFMMGSHREMEAIDAKDIMSVALDADINPGAFDVAVRQVIKGFETPQVDGLEEEGRAMVERILDNAKPRLAVLKNYLG